MSAFQDAFVHYLTRFPDLASLGEGTPPAAWKAELDAVSETAFDPVTWTSLTLESGNAGGRLGFAQMLKVRALHAIRARHDSTYTDPYTQPAPEPRQRAGFLVRLGE